MKQHQKTDPQPKPAQPTPHPPIASLSLAQLRGMATDDLVRLVISPELAQPANAAMRRQIIALLQAREGNEFVRRLLGLPPGEEAAR